MKVPNPLPPVKERSAHDVLAMTPEEHIIRAAQLGAVPTRDPALTGMTMQIELLFAIAKNGLISPPAVVVTAGAVPPGRAS